MTLNPGPITQDFVLAANPLRLNEVVVTGAGTETTRGKLGNVVNTVDTSLIQRANEPQNIVAGLVAKTPNVVIRQQSGEPGASASIRIRGASTIGSASESLIVVDGVPIDNTTIATGGGNSLLGSGNVQGDASTVAPNRASDINPNDIESVDILKGSAAAASARIAFLIRCGGVDGSAWLPPGTGWVVVAETTARNTLNNGLHTPPPHPKGAPRRISHRHQRASQEVAIPFDARLDWPHYHLRRNVGGRKCVHSMGLCSLSPRPGPISHAGQFE
jgi:hypothetical protein